MFLAMFYFYIPALLSLAAALRPTLEDKQFAYPQQEQAWHNEPISSTKRPVEIAVQARQGYHDIPRPIPPIPTLPTIAPVPIHPPEGCLAPRGQFASPRSCAHYLNCWDEIVIEQRCPGGLLFNDITNVCDFEYNVYCGHRPAPPPKPELPPGATVCPDPNGRYRSSTNCSEFYVCVYGRPIKYSCPRKLVYNEELGVCDYLYRVDCRGAAVPDQWIHPTYPPQTTKPQPPPYPYPPYYPPHYSQPPQYPAQPQPPTYLPNRFQEDEVRAETDPWHQRPVASEFELQQEADEAAKKQQQQLLQQLHQQGVDTSSLQQDPPQSPVLTNPWGQVQAIPAQLTKVPCKDGDVHRLTDSCSSVVSCREGRPQLVQCALGETYDRPSDSCKPFTLAKC